MTPQARLLRRWLHGLRYTPLHPQFLAYRHERSRHRLAGAICTGRVLDIGCGRQPLRGHLGANCEYVGLDHPRTGAWYEAKPAVHGDASSLPFKNGAFDTVVCLEVLEHLDSPGVALREAKRVLRTGGRILVSTPFLYPVHDAPTDFWRWTAHGMESLARSAGLQVRDIRVIGTPLESGVLVFNLSLAWSVLDSSALLKIIFLVLAVLSIPVTNILALLQSYFVRSVRNSPFAIGLFAVLEDGVALGAIHQVDTD